MVVEVDNGQLVLREQYIAATVNIPLTPEQAKVCTHFDMQLSIFKIKLQCHWTEGEFQSLV